MSRYLRTALIVLLGYLVAICVAPPLALVLLLTIEIATVGNPGFSGDDVRLFLFYGAYLTGIFSAVPFVVAIGTMRWFRIRNWAIHMLAGVGVCYAAMALLFWGRAPFWETHPAFPLAGAGAALTYWGLRRRFGWA